MDQERAPGAREGARRAIARGGCLRRWCLVFVVWIDGGLGDSPALASARIAIARLPRIVTGGRFRTILCGAIEGLVVRGPVRIPVVRPFAFKPGPVRLRRDLLCPLALRGLCRFRRHLGHEPVERGAGEHALVTERGGDLLEDRPLGLQDAERAVFGAAEVALDAGRERQIEPHAGGDRLGVTEPGSALAESPAPFHRDGHGSRPGEIGVRSATRPRRDLSEDGAFRRAAGRVDGERSLELRVSVLIKRFLAPRCGLL